MWKRVSTIMTSGVRLPDVDENVRNWFTSFDVDDTNVVPLIGENGQDRGNDRRPR